MDAPATNGVTLKTSKSAAPQPWQPSKLRTTATSVYEAPDDGKQWRSHIIDEQVDKNVSSSWCLTTMMSKGA